MGGQTYGTHTMVWGYMPHSTATAVGSHEGRSTMAQRRHPIMGKTMYPCWTSVRSEEVARSGARFHS
jgi:hypothetical protein